MSGSTEELSRKIDGAKDLGGVVRSMKALAASSIGQYEKAVRSLEDYSRTIELGVIACLRQAAQPAIIGERQSHEPKIAAVIFGSDQGLVGRFNEVIVEFAVTTLQSVHGKVNRVWAIGDRTGALMVDLALAPVTLLPVPNSLEAITPLVGQILMEVEASREKGEVWEVHVFHNHPKSGSLYEPVSRRLLPLDRAWQDKLAATPWPTKMLPQVIEDSSAALKAFIREYLFVLLFQACAESLASENASRLASMQRAEKNIDGILDDLNRTFHRLRQEAIDEELFDVISGFDALTAATRNRSVDTGKGSGREALQRP